HLFSANTIFQIVLIGLLLLPHCFAGPLAGTKKWHLGLPRIISGDEPHYLVLINSLIEDGDLDLRNNYSSALKGSFQAGETWAGFPLDHHTVWYQRDQRREWRDIYNSDQRWQMNEKSETLPPLKSGIAPIDENHPEYSLHGPGLAFLLAPFLYPFR